MVRFRSLLLILSLVVFGVKAYAQNPTEIPGTVTHGTTFSSSTTNGPCWSLVGSGVTTHIFTWNSIGTVSAGAVKLVGSAASDCSSSSDISTAQTVTSNGATAVLSGNVNYVRFTASTPLTGSGSVVLHYIGFSTGSSGSTTITGTVSTVPWAGGTLKTGVVTSAMTATTSTQVIAGVASNYLYITSCQFSNDHATVDTLMLLQDGSGGTAIWKGMVPHGAGSNVLFPSPLPVPTLGNGLYTVNVTTGSSTYASCQGFYTTTKYF